jgi:UDP-N-acetyl-D-mannosaminuronic acid dehydrogenase
MEELRKKIDNKSAKLAVIGLGYVGLPVAALFAEAGFDVCGIEIRTDRVELINSGKSPIEGSEPGLAELLLKVIRSGNLRATTEYSDLQDRDVILIDVETPVDDQHIPHYDALRSALTDLGPVLKPGSLVIIESTIAPGTMNEMVLPLLEAKSKKKIHKDIYLGNCPERVMPGKLLHNLRSVSRVAGGMTIETAQTMIRLYRHIVKAELDASDCITAELVKTTENAYRDVQIAFANEVALICEAVGGDVWKVRELVNKSPGRQMHLPGAGVGGHCIPKDPWLLAYGVKDKGIPLHLIPAARAINDSMPEHMVDLLQQALAKAGCQLQRARIAVLGYSYLEDSDDTRNSPSEVFVKRLRDLGATPVVHDPWVEEYKGDLLERIKGCDAAVVMVSHTIYRKLDLNVLGSILRHPVIVDGRGVHHPKRGLHPDYSYQSVGVSATAKVARN